ncbi:Rpr2-domain-containing protein [Peniophora sp. CONT]|nr:Rpr2-domain-containing protein [Peniophora sp. CONT]
MAKKSRQDEPPNPSSVANRDMLQRLNFLYQASAFLQTAAFSSAQLPTGSKQGDVSQAGTSALGSSKQAQDTRKRKRLLNTSDISRSYVHDMRQVAQKTTIRMDPSVKRSVCRRCDAILIPGVTSRTRIGPSGPHGHGLFTSCLSCKVIRRIPAPPTPSISSPSDPSLDTTEVAVDPPVTGRRKRRRGPQPRLPPLFEREGHVVFRGSEQVMPSQ